MTASDPRELIRRVCTGELPADAREVQAALRADPRLARELGELRATQKLLDAAGAEARASTASDDATLAVPDVDVAAVVRRLPPLELRTARRHRWRSLLLAAAVLVAAGLAYYQWLGSNGSSAPRQFLGDRIELGAIARGDDGSLHVTWVAPAAGTAYHAARVLHPDDGRELAQASHLPNPAWTLPPDQAAALPARVTLVLAAYDASDRPRQTRSFAVELPPR